MTDLVCDCGNPLGENDRMGDSSYACAKCGKAHRGTAVQRARVATAKESVEAAAEWRFAKRLLIGVSLGVLGLGLGLMAAAQGMGVDPTRVGKPVSLAAGLAIVGATVYAERARRRARKAEGRNPDQTF